MKKNVVGSLLLLCFLTMLNLACSNNNSNKNSMSTAKITTQSFGTFEGKPVTEYTLTNGNGMQVSLINYGGTLTKIITQAKDSTWGDVITGYDSLSGYTQNGNPYFGATIGRYANRIAKGTYTVDGVVYKAAINNNGQSLHGGLKGFDKVLWDAVVLPGDSSVQLTYLSKDG